MNPADSGSRFADSGPWGGLSQLRHELRSPLNAVIGYSEMLLEDVEADPRLTTLTSRLYEVRDAGQRMLFLINNALDPARGEPEGERPDFVAIRQQLRLPCREMLGCCELLLALTEDEQFAPFVPDIHQVHLSGVRLQGLIDELKPLEPAAVVEPSPSRGPREWEVPAEAAATEGPAASRGPLTGRILVVDDLQVNRELLVQRLAREGHSPVAVTDGAAALDRVRAEPFDLILLDVMMPGLDGSQVLQVLKSDSELRHIPVIMISAVDELDTVVRCIQHGAEDFLPKPFNPVLLKARIDASLEKKRLRDQEVRLFQQLRENYERLQDLEKLRDSLTNMVVHDLRTPMTSLLTGLMTVEDLGQLNEDQREFIQMAVQGGQTLLAMIHDLLDISKMENGSLHLECTDLIVRDLVNASVGEVSHLARRKEIRLDTEVAPGLPVLMADADKLRRMMSNLLGNAVKFTPEAGSVRVSAHHEPASGEVVLAVTDTGEGIPAEAFGRIFEKFGQVETRRAGRKMSTGLGLTFCKMVAEAHGGRIWVESELGTGSTFSVALPVLAA